MPLRIAVLVCLMSLACSVAARAADDGAVTITPPTASADTVTATTEPAATPPLPAWVAREAQKRPTALSALYGSYGTLAVADLISSKKAFAAGAHERNPIMGSGAVTRMVVVKSAGAAMSIYFAERMWKKNRIGAIVTMAVVNSISATVVARNLQVARR
jgi:hypothetical protein